MHPLNNNNVYLNKWYQVYADIFKSMGWNVLKMSPEMDDTIINAWQYAKMTLNEDEYNFSTYTTYEQIIGTKPDTSSPDGCSRFNTFTTAYNKFCAEQNFKATEGFSKAHNSFFKYFLANSPKTTATANAPTKSVRFTSAPLITTLKHQLTSSPKEFPTLQAPTKAPISYTSTTLAFIPVTRRQQNKQTTDTPMKPTAPTTPKPPTTTPGAKQGPKSLRPTKPPLPNALKMTKHTIILDHANPETKAKYSMDAREVTQGLQHHLEAVKVPLILLVGTWLTTPFYKNFILTFSGIVNYTDITKYDLVLFRPFGANCRAAPIAGYQSILISGVHL
jgi:hypothetical protein